MVFLARELLLPALPGCNNAGPGRHPNITMYDNNNLATPIHRHALSRAQAPAVVCQGRSLSYGQLAARAAHLAQTLRTAPAWPRDPAAPPRIGILASRSVEACVALLGACWAGATYVPLGLKQPEDRLLALLGQCDLAAVVCDDAGARLLSARLRAACPPLLVHVGLQPLPQPHADVLVLAGDLPSATDLPADGLPPPVPMKAEDTAYIIFTSGTTGTPKGVMISCAAARHYLATITRHLGLRADDRALETCELSFDFSVHNMFSTWEAGAALHILPATLVMNAVKYARTAGLTVWNSVPSLAGMLRQIKALAPDSLAGLRVTVFGGEQLPAGVVEAWSAAAPGATLFNLYGPTEATVFCLAQTVRPPLPLTPGRDVVAIGQPLPGNTARVVDGEGNELPDGTPGELLIGGAQLALGYLGAPALTAARFPHRDGLRGYRTGDLALRDSAGNFHCLGRIDNQIKVQGYRVELEEIDAHLRSVSGVDVVGAIGWPVQDGTARGIVSFVGAEAIDAEAILGALKQRLPHYMLPGRVIALAQMPLNTSGKVDRKALHRLLDEGAVGRAPAGGAPA